MPDTAQDNITRKPRPKSTAMMRLRVRARSKAGERIGASSAVAGMPIMDYFSLVGIKTDNTENNYRNTIIIGLRDAAVAILVRG
jgi:hypothetical protein